MDKASKLRKLETFRRRVNHVSASALESILTEQRTMNLDLFDRASIRKARDQRLGDITPFGTVLTTLPIVCKDGSHEDVVVINPLAMLYLSAKSCRGFANLLRTTLIKHPCTYDDPWSFVLYADEVVPGNQLSFNNKRKVWAIYFSFQEFGTAVLSMEDAWFCVAAERTDRVKYFDGGIAQVFSTLLKLVFGTATPHTLNRSGIMLDLEDGSSVRMFAKLNMILQDGGAHKVVFMVKGDGGSKFCMSCRNLYSIASDIVDEDGDAMLTCSHVLEDELDFATDDDIRGTVRRLAAHAAVVDADERKLREQAAGFNHNRFNMLLDPELDDVLHPISQFAHDWMHTFVVHGVWNTVLLLLLKAITRDNVPDAPAQFAEYISLWTFPLRLGGGNIVDRLVDTFSKSRWTSAKKANYVKCTASDAITMYGIIGLYVAAVFLRADRCSLECLAYLCLVDVLDLLVASPHGTVTPAILRAAIDKFLRACVLAGWTAQMHPKFHWCIHLPYELGRFIMLLSCWVHERKHKMVKRYSSEVRNTNTYETTILSEVTCHHLQEMESDTKFDLTIGLISPKPAKRRLIAFLRAQFAIEHNANVVFMTSASARVNEFEVCRPRDVVVYFDPTVGLYLCGEVWLFASGNGVCIALISKWGYVNTIANRRSLTVRVADDAAECVALEDIKAACTYRRKSDGTAQILVPPSCLGLRFT